MDKPKHFIPEKATWKRQAALAHCACTEPDKMECTNFDIESTTVDGNEACTCRCHKSQA